MLNIKGEYGPEYKVHDPGDGVIGRALRTGEPYEAKVLYHIYRMGLKGTALDIGAHIGNHTLWFALACDFDEVCAFEPLEYERLMDNLKLNGLDYVSRSEGPKMHAWPVALGSRPSRANPIGKGTLETSMNGNGKVAVCVLDQFNLENVTLMKIDVEGWEPEVLRGATETIKRCHPVIFAEAQDADAERELAEVLTPLGYRHVRTYGATPLLEWKVRNGR